MSRSLISKQTIEALEERAPEDYGVEDNILNIDIYPSDEGKELFDTLYMGEDKIENPEYLLKMVSAATKYTSEDLVLEEFDESLTVEEKLIDDHRRAAVLMLDGDRVYVHYK